MLNIKRVFRTMLVLVLCFSLLVPTTAAAKNKKITCSREMERVPIVVQNKKHVVKIKNNGGDVSLNGFISFKARKAGTYKLRFSNLRLGDAKTTEESVLSYVYVGGYKKGSGHDNFSPYPIDSESDSYRMVSSKAYEEMDDTQRKTVQTDMVYKLDMEEGHTLYIKAIPAIDESGRDTYYDLKVRRIKK